MKNLKKSRGLSALASILAALMSLFGLPAHQLEAGELIEGLVLKVSDGDTLLLLSEHGEKIKVRLYGIDAPEKKQAYGPEAHEALSALALDRTVKVERVARDKYRRLVGIVEVEGLSLNRVLLSSGLAWVDPRFCKRKKPCNRYWQSAREARRDGLGLWSDASPQPPWQWRGAGRTGNAAPASLVH